MTYGHMLGFILWYTALHSLVVSCCSIFQHHSSFNSDLCFEQHYWNELLIWKLNIIIIIIRQIALHSYQYSICKTAIGRAHTVMEVELPLTSHNYQTTFLLMYVLLQSTISSYWCFKVTDKINVATYQHFLCMNYHRATFEEPLSKLIMHRDMHQTYTQSYT